MCCCKIDVLNRIGSCSGFWSISKVVTYEYFLYFWRLVLGSPLYTLWRAAVEYFLLIVRSFKHEICLGILIFCRMEIQFCTYRFIRCIFVLLMQVFVHYEKWWLSSNVVTCWNIFFIPQVRKKKCICSFSHGMQRLTLCSGHESLPVTTTISCMWHVSRECFIYHPLITFFFPLYLVVWSLPTDITVFFEDTYFTTTISQIHLK